MKDIQIILVAYFTVIILAIAIPIMMDNFNQEQYKKEYESKNNRNGRDKISVQDSIKGNRLQQGRD